jgi:hypothetical protein
VCIVGDFKCASSELLVPACVVQCALCLMQMHVIRVFHVCVCVCVCEREREGERERERERKREREKERESECFVCVFVQISRDGRE